MFGGDACGKIPCVYSCTTHACATHAPWLTVSQSTLYGHGLGSMAIHLTRPTAEYQLAQNRAAYDTATSHPRIQPAVDLLFTDSTSTPKPVILDVPVLIPSGGGFTLHFPLISGDAMMLMLSHVVHGIRLDNSVFML